jgi:hypothetical protein
LGGGKERLAGDVGLEELLLKLVLEFESSTVIGVAVDGRGKLLVVKF